MCSERRGFEGGLFERPVLGSQWNGGVGMTHSSSTRIHPTALLSPDVELGEHVEIGPYAVLEGKIKIGDHCVIRPGAYLYGPLTMGRRNTVFTGAVLGERPQHLKYNGEDT